MDLFGQSIAWECPITDVKMMKQGKQVEAVVWIVTNNNGGDSDSSDDHNIMSQAVTVDQIIENLHNSDFRGKTIQVRMAHPDESSLA